jgi:hypothetical protein
MEHVGWQHELRAVGDAQIWRRLARRQQTVEFSKERLQVHGYTGTQQIDGTRGEDPGRQQMQGEAAEVIDDRVSCIAAALEADNDICRCGEGIGDLALALISPSGTDDGGNWHMEAPSDFYSL